MVAERYEAPKEEPISREKEEFLLILEEFRKFVYRAENSAEAWEVFEDIVALRASFLIDRVLTGLRMDFDKAFDLLKNFNSSLTERERQERDILVAAIENLVDFAVAEEFQMINELPEELDIEDMEEYEEICEKYNFQYASVENEDVLYSASMAYWWIGIASQLDRYLYDTRGRKSPGFTFGIGRHIFSEKRVSGRFDSPYRTMRADAICFRMEQAVNRLLRLLLTEKRSENIKS